MRTLIVYNSVLDELRGSDNHPFAAAFNKFQCRFYLWQHGTRREVPLIDIPFSLFNRHGTNELLTRFTEIQGDLFYRGGDYQQLGTQLSGKQA